MLCSRVRPFTLLRTGVPGSRAHWLLADATLSVLPEHKARMIAVSDINNEPVSIFLVGKIPLKWLTSRLSSQDDAQS